jgi:hypothetical protein
MMAWFWIERDGRNQWALVHPTGRISGFESYADASNYAQGHRVRPEDFQPVTQPEQEFATDSVEHAADCKTEAECRESAGSRLLEVLGPEAFWNRRFKQLGVAQEMFSREPG